MSPGVNGGHHDGRFYVFVCTPYDGLFMWHATDPRGPWSKTVTVKAVSGWEDPAPFWDDDGSAWLVHSVLGAGPLILHRMSADGRALLDDGVEIYRGPVAEGPKLFKRGGYYYISLPEGGVERGGQTVLRSGNLLGPWERREVLPGGSPHQGGLVDLPSGESWFIGLPGTRSGCAGATPGISPGSSTASTVAPSRHQRRVHARLRPLEGGEVRNLLLRKTRASRRRLGPLSLRHSRGHGPRFRWLRKRAPGAVDRLDQPPYSVMAVAQPDELEGWLPAGAVVLPASADRELSAASSTVARCYL